MLTKLYINMHCISCEMLLTEEINKLEGVKIKKINFKTGECLIEHSDERQLDKINKIIQKNDFNCSFEPITPQRDIKLLDYLQTIIILIILTYLFRMFNASYLFPKISGSANILIALLIGFIASLSTCLALVGGLLIGLSSTFEQNASPQKKLFTQIYFQIGRIGGFFLLGGLLGLIGEKLTYSLNFTGYFTMAISLVMFYLGLQILNIVPNIAQWGFHLPKSWAEKIKQQNKFQSIPLFLGALTFFLPCGFTQSMQLLAVSSGSFLRGALIMSAFALGTTPVLFSVGLGTGYISGKKWDLAKKIIGAMVIMFSIYSLNSGLVLIGQKQILTQTKPQTTSTQVGTEYQVVKMDIDWVFSPSQFEIKKGTLVRWEINGINITGCTNEIVIPKLNIRKRINQGLNVIEFMPPEADELYFSCWMGMQSGKFIIK